VDQYRKPDFFIVGAPKCGTTSMYHYLRQHDQIFMPDEKEPHYFGEDLKKRPDKFIDNEDEYLNLFKDAKPDQKLGEASTFYLYSKSASREIKEYNPDAKIIIMLRNPIDFLNSLHSQLLFSGNEDEPDFEIAMELEEIALRDEFFIERKLFPNVDFYSGLVYRKLGIPRDLFTPVFAISRVAGWLAHWREQLGANRIFRPSQIYTGAQNRTWIPSDERVSSTGA